MSHQGGSSLVAHKGSKLVPHYPPPNNPNICKVACIYLRDTRTFVNTFNVQKGVAWAFPDMVTLANVVKTWFTTNYAPVIPTNIALVQIQVRKLSPIDPLAYDLNVTPPVPGTRTGAAEAGNVTGTLSERTGFAGRAYRGRMYVPGLSENDVTATDTLTSTATSLMATAISTLISTMVANAFKLVVFHRPGLIPNVRDNTYNEVISFVVQALVDSQRRRLPGRGR